MSETIIRKDRRAGRITLNRPRAMNALTPGMAARIGAALDAWTEDDAVEVVVIDAAGDKAFCAGGDITLIFDCAKSGDLETPRAFWREEYRLNANIFTYPKPVVSLMQGFTMGGGVGIGCHAAHRVVGESSRIAMPECGIGLVPDVGGSLILGRAPGHLGEYLGTTAHRMGPADAILAGFADRVVPEAAWPDLVDRLAESGDPRVIDAAAAEPDESALAARRAHVDRHFAQPDMAAVVGSLERTDDDFARETLAALARVSPLSACCTLELVREARARGTIHGALEMEYRFTHRAIEDADLIEGIRAAVIDRDRAPRWRHDGIAHVPPAEVRGMLAPLGADGLDWEEDA